MHIYRFKFFVNRSLKYRVAIFPIFSFQNVSIITIYPSKNVFKINHQYLVSKSYYSCGLDNLPSIIDITISNDIQVVLIVY